MKKQEEIVLKIDSISHDGRGIAESQQKKIFVTGALPGETVLTKITKCHSRYNEAETLNVITSSDKRINPDCQYHNLCGGCSLQHASTEFQLSLKEQTLIEQLQHFGKVKPQEIIPPISGKTSGYRSKARLGVRYVRKKEKLLVGFREKNSNYLADIDSCSVLDPRVGLKLRVIADLIRSLEQYESIPQIEVAASADEIVLIFRHLKSLPEIDIEKMKEFGKQHNFSIYLQPNAPEALKKIWPLDDNTNLTYSLPQYGLNFKFNPLDFTQVNQEINKEMVALALTWLAPAENENILDLFCGLGNFTLPIAKYAKTVTGVEGSAAMVKRAEENSKFNSIHNTTFYDANLEKPNTACTWMQKKYDKILLDPPRTGAQTMVEQIDRFGAKKIVYVSCNPATLARDAGILVHQQGYTLKAAGIINMFPHTSHVESIAIFEK